VTTTGNMQCGFSRFCATVCKTVRPMLSDRCLSCLSSPVCDVGVLWPNGWTDQDETWHAGRPRPQPHCVRDEISSSPTERGITAPTFEIYGRRLCLRPYNPRSMSIVAKRLDESRVKRDMAQIDFCALLGLEMVTDGDILNKHFQINLKKWW